MIHNYECKLGNRRAHLVRTPIELPCQSLACLVCVVEHRDFFCNLRCVSCGQVHRVADDALLKNTMFLERYLRLNTREIAFDMHAKLKKSLFYFKGDLLFSPVLTSLNFQHKINFNFYRLFELPKASDSEHVRVSRTRLARPHRIGSHGIGQSKRSSQRTTRSDCRRLCT